MHILSSGEIISLSVAKIREKEYELDENIGSFMYFFAHKNKQYCVDATDETPFKGRLINHSILRPNLKTKVRFYWIQFIKNWNILKKLILAYGSDSATKNFEAFSKSIIFDKIKMEIIL